MRLSELLRCPVVDGSGRDVGRVCDVRLVRDGPPMGAFGAAFRVQGLIVGPALAGTRLGYGRTGMTGPVLLNLPLRVLHRRVRFVAWERIEEVGKDTIRISGSADDLHEPAPIRS
jgi:hypothetical protein